MEAISRLLSEINHFRLNSCSNILWFRGHSNKEYNLNSSLYRFNLDNDELRKRENNVYQAFVNLGHGFCKDFMDYKQWNTLFLMQHYGLYTRLLDWTDSMVIALYFALCNKKKQMKHVYGY